MPSPRTDVSTGGRFLRRLDVRLTVAVASTALLALLISGMALSQILPGFFEQQAQARLRSAANSTALLITDAATRAAEQNLGQYLTDQAQREARIIQPAAELAANQIALATVEVFNVRDGSQAAHAAPENAARLEDEGLFPDPVEPAAVEFSIELPLAEPLAPDGELKLRVVVSEPYTARQTTLQQVGSALIGAGALALLGALLVGIVASRRMTVPLARLGRVSRRLSQGELDVRVPPSGVEEIDQLGVQFNLMADRVAESVRLLEADRDRLREFVADVSHELRTPITALRTFIELQRDGAVDEATRREFLDRSEEQLLRLEWMSTNLLDLSRIDAGIFPLDIRPGDLRDPVRLAVEGQEGPAEAKRLRLTAELPAESVLMRFDRERIVQLVGNLVANAVKFSPEGGGVRVLLAQDGANAVVEVSDQGPGIPAGEMPRIFDRFYRGTNVGEARASGSGLGLAIARSIAEMHDGHIEVASQIGKGAVFRVILPRKDQ
jgi:signal transduction histidine kinase